jgi:hypothetical protein
MIVALLLTTVALAGCSKALTESSAPGVVQKWIDSQNGGGVLVSTFSGELTEQVGTEMINRWSVPDVQRLIKQGYLEEKTVSVLEWDASCYYTALDAFSPDGRGDARGKSTM